jgi:hypothetical protein
LIVAVLVSALGLATRAVRVRVGATRGLTVPGQGQVGLLRRHRGIGRVVAGVRIELVVMVDRGRVVDR